MNNVALFPLFVTTFLLLFAMSARPPAAPAQESSAIFYEDTKTKDILRKALNDEKQGRWKEAITRYLQALEKYPNENHPIVNENGQETISFSEEKGPGRRMGVREFIFLRLKRMPPEGLRVYREDLGFNAKAKREFEEGRRAGDLRRIEQAVERYFFSVSTDEALDYLANRALEAGNIDDAIHHWKRIITSYPDPDIPPAMILAKIARSADCHPLLSSERKWAADKLPTIPAGSSMIVANDEARLPADAIKASAPPPTPKANLPRSGRRLPLITTPEEICFPEPAVVKGDVQDWSADLAEERPAPAVEVIYEGMPRPLSAKSSHSAFVPASATQGTKSYVVAQNGVEAMAVNPENGKCYWREKFGKRPSQGGEATRVMYGGASGLRPVVFGCATDGTLVLANQYSLQPDNAQTVAYPTAIRAIDLRTGKLVWDSEEVNPRAMEEKDLAFAMPPVVAGDRVYAAATNAQGGEQEVYVVAFDKRNGRLLWQTFVCSRYGTNVYRGYPMTNRTPPTLTVAGGTVYCQTNIGCVAAINGASGHLVWLTEYKRVDANRIYRRGEGQPRESSGPNWCLPLVIRDTLYVLPSDSDDLNAIRKETGVIIKDRFRSGSGDIPWTSLNAASERYLSVGAAAETIVDLQNPEIALTLTGSTPVGKGIFVNNLYYLPTASGIIIYHAGSWRIFAETARWDERVGGNILICGDHIIVQSSDGNRITGYTSHETLLRSTAFKIRQEPVRPEPLLEYSRKMMTSERYDDAIAGYERLLWLVSDVPEYRLTEEEARDRLYTAWRRLGLQCEKDIAAESKSRASEMHARSKGYAAPGTQTIDATLSLARTLEYAGHLPEAVGQYQELIASPSRTHPCNPQDAALEEEVGRFARGRIETLITANGTGIYASIEQRAAKMRATIRPDDGAAVLDLLRSHPNSAAAAEAVKALDMLYKKQERWPERLALLKTIGRRHPGLVDESVLRLESIDTLKKMKEWGQLRAEIDGLAERFAGREIPVQGGVVKTDDLIRVERQALDALLPPTPPLKEPLKMIGEIRAPTREYDPLRPAGDRPIAVEPDLDLVRLDGALGLRRYSDGKMLRRFVHPGWDPRFTIIIKEENTLTIETVEAGSAAEKAGVRRYDAIKSVNGRPVSLTTLSAIMASVPVGSRVRLDLERSGKSVTVEIEAAPYTESCAIPFVDAAWNRDGHLLAAWQDGVGCFRAEGGVPLWTATVPYPLRKIDSIALCENGLLIVESPANRDANMRGAAPGDVDPKTPSSGETRIVRVDDLTGETLWSRNIPALPANQYYGRSTGILCLASGGGAALLIVPAPPQAKRSGESPWSASVIDSRTGAVISSKPLGYRPMIEVDRERGRAAVVSYDRDSFTLTCFSVDAAANKGRIGELWTKALSVRLHNWYSSGESPPFMAMNAEAIVMIADPAVVRVFSIPDNGSESTINLPDGRRIVPGRSACAVGSREVMAVYNNAAEDVNKGYMTFVDIKKGKMLWDGPAPDNLSSAPALLADQPNFLILYTPHGSLPGSGNRGPIGLIYSIEKQGTIVREFQDLVPIAVSPSPANGPSGAIWIDQNRIHVRTPKGVEVYGN